jgi:hypothetical protein
MRNSLLLASALALLVSGCYGHYYGEYEYDYDAPPDGPVIVEAPPAPMVEEIPPEPWVGAVWVDGYWNWTGHTYIWVRGRYLRPPRVGLIWYHGGYVRTARGYVYVRGRWAAPGYRVRYRYVHTPRWHSRRHHYRGGAVYHRHYRSGRGPRYAPAPRGRRGPPGHYRGDGRGRRPPGAEEGSRRGPRKHRAPPAGGGAPRGPRKHRAPPAR